VSIFEESEIKVIPVKELKPGDIVIISAPKDSKVHGKDSMCAIDRFFKPYGVRLLFSYPEIGLRVFSSVIEGEKENVK